MSYDIEIIKVHKQVCLDGTDLNFQVQTTEYSTNYTTNVFEMLEECMESLQEKELIPCYYTHWTEPITKDVDKAVTLFIMELKSNREHYEKFNPENGWGTYDGVIRWLSEIEKYQNQGFKIQISW